MQICFGVVLLSLLMTSLVVHNVYVVEQYLPNADDLQKDPGYVQILTTPGNLSRKVCLNSPITINLCILLNICVQFPSMWTLFIGSFPKVVIANNICIIGMLNKSSPLPIPCLNCDPILGVVASWMSWKILVSLSLTNEIYCHSFLHSIPMYAALALAVILCVVHSERGHGGGQQ